MLAFDQKKKYLLIDTFENSPQLDRFGFFQLKAKTQQYNKNLSYYS